MAKTKKETLKSKNTQRKQLKKISKNIAIIRNTRSSTKKSSEDENDSDVTYCSEIEDLLHETSQQDLSKNDRDESSTPPLLIDTQPSCSKKPPKKTKAEKNKKKSKQPKLQEKSKPKRSTRTQIQSYYEPPISKRKNAMHVELPLPDITVKQAHKKDILLSATLKWQDTIKQALGLTKTVKKHAGVSVLSRLERIQSVYDEEDLHKPALGCWEAISSSLDYFCSLIATDSETPIANTQNPFVNTQRPTANSQKNDKPTKENASVEMNTELPNNCVLDKDAELFLNCVNLLINSNQNKKESVIDPSLFTPGTWHPVAENNDLGILSDVTNSQTPVAIVNDQTKDSPLPEKDPVNIFKTFRLQKSDFNLNAEKSFIKPTTQVNNKQTPHSVKKSALTDQTYFQNLVFAKKIRSLRTSSHTKENEREMVPLQELDFNLASNNDEEIMETSLPELLLSEDVIPPTQKSSDDKSQAPDKENQVKLKTSDLELIKNVKFVMRPVPGQYMPIEMLPESFWNDNKLPPEWEKDFDYFC